MSLSQTTVVSGGTYSLSGLTVFPGTSIPISWTGTATASFSGTSDNWVADYGTIQDEATSIGVSGSGITYTDPTLINLGAPNGDNGLAIAPAVEGPGLANEAISYSFSSPVAAGTSFLLVAPGAINDSINGPYTFTFAASLAGSVVSTSGWSFLVKSLTDTALPGTFNVNSSTGVVTVSNYNNNTYAVVVATPNTPIDHISVTASTIETVGWGLAFASSSGTVHVSPTVTAVSTVSVFENQAIAGSSLVASINNPSGDKITQYIFLDEGGGTGYFTYNGVRQPDGQWIYPNDSSSIQGSTSVQYVGGSSPGTDTLEVGIYDYTTNTYSYSSTFTAATTPPPPPPSGTESGFDISAFPEMNIMDWLQANTNLNWVGYYLLAPGHTGASWLGTRSELTNAGWSIAPIYFGQQDTSAWTRTAAQGVIDADQAASEMGTEGFALGTVVYLDIENGQVTPSELTYANAWCAELAKDGYTAGIYAPGSDFTELTSQYPNAQEALQWVADYQNPSYWPTAGTTIFSDPGLSSVHPSAAAWQYDAQYTGHPAFNISTPYGTIGVDLDVVAIGTPTPFAITDVTAGVQSLSDGTPYTGPVSGLVDQYINTTADNLNITAGVANMFIHTGSGEDAIDVSHVGGTNVLDGGTNSNFLVGGTGPSSFDTFFVDDRGPSADIWSTVANFHAGDAATIFGITTNGFDTNWVDGQGAAGYTGLTLHVTAPGVPTASLTLSGYTSADLTNGRLTTSYGTENDGTPYLYVHGN